VQVPVPVETFDAVDQCQALLGAFGHRYRNRTVQLDDRRRRELGQPLVERRDLGPVGLGLEVERGDRGL